MAIGLPVKANYAAGDILTATNMNDLSGTFNQVATSYGNAAGKNLVINGGLDIWQRGTSFSVGAFSYTYTADRWQTFNGNACTISQETTTLPSGSRYALKLTGGATTSGYEVWQPIETLNAIQFAGQNATASIQITGTTGRTATITVDYSTSADVAGSGSWTALSPSSSGGTLTSGTFTKLTATVAIPSTAKSLRFRVTAQSLANTEFIIFGKAQLELGSVATAFTKAGGTIQGELAACQRYYWRSGGNIVYQRYGNGSARSTNQIDTVINFPVTMRTTPTSLDYSNIAVYDGSTVTATTAIALDQTSPMFGALLVSVASGLTQFRPYSLLSNNTTNAYLGFSAEL